MTVKTDVPNTYKESIPETLTEQEAYAKSRQINKNDKDHHAVVENGKLKVNQVLRG